MLARAVHGIIIIFFSEMAKYIINQVSAKDEQRLVKGTT
jgi:hypothetical protein